MAELGQRLKNERPPLGAELVSRMVAYLEATPPPDMHLRMMRPMLMRTVAVIVGPDSVPALERCAEESAEYGSLCRDTIAEIGG